jgi:branched-chain amino acid transport system ATP-binding protein
VTNRDSAPLLETQGLTRRFGGLVAVSDLALEVCAGGVYAVIGPNGAGKTTLFNLITGELKPTAGRILFKGSDITGLPPHVITRLGISRKFQITQIFPSLSVRDNVLLAVRRRRRTSWLDLVRPSWFDDDVSAILESMHLAHVADLRAAVLAHGEQQRLELAMVLGTGAELLLLDEPTSGMSVEERGEMASVLRRLALRATVVVTEHDFDFIREVADRVTVLDKGRKLAEGNVAEISANAAVQECYLGPEDA